MPEAGGRSGAAWIAAMAVILALRILIPISTAALGTEAWSTLTMVADSGMYIRFSEAIGEFPHEPPSWRTPGYPLLLSLLRGDEGSPFLPAVLAQQAADLLVAVMIGWMASRTAGIRWWRPATLYLLLPVPLVHSMLILPDTFMVLACASSGVLWLASRGRGRAGFQAMHAAAGLALGLGTLLKPVLLYSPVVYAPLVLAFRRGWSLPDRLVALLLLIAFALAPPMAWRMHNILAHDMDALSMQDAFEPMGRIGVLSGAVQADSLGFLMDRITRDCTRNGRLDIAARDSVFRSITIDSFRSNPAGVIVPHLISWPMFFKPGVAYMEDLPFFGAGPGRQAFLVLKVLAGLVNVLTGLALLLTLAGRGAWREHPSLSALALSWFVFSALTAGPLADNPRYGLPFYWIAAVFPLLTARRLLWRRYADQPAKPAASQTGMKGSA